MSGERIGMSISSTPAPEHVSYVAGAIVEILAAGAEHRTSEAILHAALRVLGDASQPAPVHVNNAQISTGDEKTGICIKDSHVGQ